MAEAELMGIARIAAGLQVFAGGPTDSPGWFPLGGHRDSPKARQPVQVAGQLQTHRSLHMALRSIARIDLDGVIRRILHVAHGQVYRQGGVRSPDADSMGTIQVVAGQAHLQPKVLTLVPGAPVCWNSLSRLTSGLREHVKRFLVEHQIRSAKVFLQML
jgi:hypothetical protein